MEHFYFIWTFSFTNINGVCRKKKGLWLAISSLAGDVFSSENCFWESLNVGFLENDFICYTKVILKCQTSFGSCSCFVF